MRTKLRAVADEPQHGHGAHAEPSGRLLQRQFPTFRHLAGTIDRHAMPAAEGTHPRLGPGIAPSGLLAEDPPRSKRGTGDRNNRQAGTRRAICAHGIAPLRSRSGARPSSRSRERRKSRSGSRRARGRRSHGQGPGRRLAAPVPLRADDRRGVATRHAAAHDGLGALIKPRAVRVDAVELADRPQRDALQACDPLASRRTLRERRRTPRPPAGAEINGRDRHRASRCMRWPDPVAVPTRHPAAGSAGRLVGPAESLAIMDCSTTATGAPKPVASSTTSGTALPATPTPAGRVPRSSGARRTSRLRTAIRFGTTRPWGPGARARSLRRDDDEPPARQCSVAGIDRGRVLRSGRRTTAGHYAAFGRETLDARRRSETCAPDHKMRKRHPERSTRE